MAQQRGIESVLALDSGISLRENSNIPAVVVPVEQLHDILSQLRHETRFAYDMLMTHTAIDWIKESQFEVVYQLFSTRYGDLLQVSCRVPRENPVVPTVRDLWKIAEWQEREAFDLMGILYDNHPDLRRVFLDDDWQGHPLRKDYVDADMLERPK